MLELTPANAADYLRRKGWVGPGPVDRRSVRAAASPTPSCACAHTESVFILKQSRPQLRTRDAWFSDLDRVYREQEVMQVLSRYCRRTRSRKSFLATATNMSSPCPAPGRRRGRGRNRCWPATSTMDARRARGAVLGRMHDATARNPALIDAFRDRAVFVQLRVDPFYRRIQERRPEVAPAVAAHRRNAVVARSAVPRRLQPQEHPRRMKTASRWSITRRPTTATRRWTSASS